MTARVLHEIWPIEQAFRNADEWDDCPPAARRIAENCCHFYLSNGWVVSVLMKEFGDIRFFETWAWTGGKVRETRTIEPVSHDTIDEALTYVEEAKTW